jgi:hypothetical protein
MARRAVIKNIRNNNNNNKVLYDKENWNINTEYVLHNQIKKHSLATGGLSNTRYSDRNNENHELRVNIVTQTALAPLRRTGTAIVSFLTSLTLSSCWLSCNHSFLGPSTSVLRKGFCFE